MKTKTTTVTELEYHELDDRVTKFLTSKGYKWPDGSDGYECVAEQEWSNDESHALNVDGKITKREIEDLMSDGLAWRLDDILDWMASEGEIPKGTYKINICW